MMIVQSTPIILKQRNQPNRECLYAWYPEAVSPTVQEPRDIYIHKGIDKDLIRQPTPIREGTRKTLDLRRMKLSDHF